MRARAIVGKRVLRVDQVRVHDDVGTQAIALERIVFSNGMVLFFTVHELDGDYAVIGHTVMNKDQKWILRDGKRVRVI